MTRAAMISGRWTSMLLVLGVAAVLGQDYAIDWHTIDGGGGMGSAGGSYSLGGTIGQPDASVTAMTGGTYTLTGGFWAAAWSACTSFAPADFDRDCDVDGADLEVMWGCTGGPELPVTAGCTLAPGPGGRVGADFDADDDVDHDDFGVFQRCYSGPDLVADPGCAG